MNTKSTRSFIALLCVFLSLVATAFHAFAIDITTWKGDNLHTGVNASETILTPTLISTSGKIGLLFNQSVEGQVYAQPLYKENVTINGLARNVVFVATEHNYVYAFDADSNLNENSTYLWRTNLSPTGTTTVPEGDTNSGDLTFEIGITGTPVIDSSTNTLYVISKCKRTSTYEQYFNALDIQTGAHKFGSPVLINPTYPGTGNGSSGGVIPFNALRQHNRPSLALHNGVVYAGFASHSDAGPYHGWLIGFNAADLTVAKKFITAPNSDQAGLWMGASSPAIDPQGFLHVLTGNGTVNPANNSWGEAFLKLPTTGSFTVPNSNSLNWYIPNDWDTLNFADLDLGAGGPLILPDQAGPHPHLVVGGGKGGVLYVIDRDNMGGNATPDAAIQKIVEGGTKRLFCTPSYFNGYLYYAPVGSPLLQRAVSYVAASGDYVAPTPISSTWVYNGGKGATPFITANGTQNGIVWVVSAGTPSELHAYNASNVSGNPIFKYTTKFGASQINETACKYTLPIVSNGKIYLTAFNGANNGHLYVLGVLEGQVGTPSAPTNLIAAGSGSSSIALDWTDTSSNESNFSVRRSTAPTGPFTEVFLASANVTTYSDAGLNPSTTYYYQVAATNSVGGSFPTNTASATTFPPYTDNGLVGYWPFDEGTGSVLNDVTGNGHTGSNANTETTWVSGVNDNTVYNGLNAINFHGAGNAPSRVAIADKSDLRFTATQSFTVSAWVYSANVNGIERAVFAKSRGTGNYYGLWQSAANKWVFRGPTGDVVGSNVVGNTWTHLTGVQDGATNTRKLYINGALVASGSAQAANGNGDLWIGQTPLATAESFAGIIDEVRLYSRALSTNEITNLMGPPALKVTSNVIHGSAGTFEKTVAPYTYKTLESRRGATQGTYDIAMNFAVPVSNISASLQLQAGSSGSPVGSTGNISYSNGGRTATVRLTGVGNIQPLSIRLTGIQPAGGSLDIPVNILWGDVNSDNVVDAADVSVVQGNQNAAISSTTYPFDVNCDGVINGTDTTIVQGLVGTNLGAQTNNLLSLNKPSYSSSDEDPVGLAPKYANDASITTRWSSQHSNPQWIYIDLEQPCNVRAVTLRWENAAGKDYTLEIADAPTGPWTNLVPPITNNSTANADLNYTGFSANGRYVRMYGTARTGPYGFSLWDFKVFGSLGSNSSSAPVITSSLTASGTVGTALSYQITATSSPTSYGASGLPAGLSVNTTTGAISGTPSTAGTVNSTITATNAFGSDSKTLVFTIGSAGSPPVINSPLTKAGTVGTALSYTITATNSPTSFGASGLPAGLSVNTSTGVISGTPTATGTTNSTITATNAAGSDSKTLVFTINPAAPVITSAGSVSGTVGTALNYTITATNNPTSYGASGLPAGLSVNTGTGVISGTPTAAGTTNATITATNGGGTGSAGLTFNISAGGAAPVITSALTKSGAVGTSFSYTITANNNPTSFNATNLPAGLSINTSTGVISGTPTTAGTTNTSISATNTSGADTKTLVITISASGDINLALNQPTYHSSFLGGNSSGLAVDNDVNSRWESEWSNPQWIYVDLGASSTVHSVILNWENAAGRDYKIQISTDSVVWNDLREVVGNTTPGVKTYDGLDAVGRYVRVHGTARTTDYGFSLLDFQVIGFLNGPRDVNLALNQPVYVSSEVAPNLKAGAVDNTTTTRWESEGTDLQWIYVDLGSVKSFNTVILNWENAAGRDYKIQVSSDAIAWSDLANVVNNSATGVLAYSNLNASGRYVRMNGTLRASPWGYSLWDFQVLGSATATPSITSSLNASGTVGTPFNYQITATNNPTSYNATGLPPGLAVNTSTGVISGTPTGAGGSFTPVISATNAGGTGSATLALTINPADTNVSQGKTATASSFQAGNLVANGNDGNAGTRWAAADGSYPQWWKVNLGSAKVLSRMDIEWFNAATRAYKYKIEVSPDDITYSLVKDNTNNTTFGNTSDSFSATAQFVKVTVTGATGGFASAFELKVFGH